MPKLKRQLFLLTLLCIAVTALGVYVIGGIDPVQIQQHLQKLGVWAPVIYVVLYIVATLLLLPSTALNLAGGALFGLWVGTLWTSIAAVIAAVVTFWFTRTIGYDFVSKRFVGQWKAIDAEFRSGGLFYIFAIRLLPLIPYGLVNFAAGLTSIRFRDYFWGTTFGTFPGVFPFVMLGSSGLKVMKTGDILPLLTALGLIGLLMLGSTWYRRRCSR
ncbi:MAG: TVP38/TMEM64 family protein [Oscillatoriales cyanobacterium C42_A2020_001]|nr:TVP38/TMEM64 family protein [Leptolyngbyaceae cyanobacterium C42_A2020_001]